MDNEQIKLKYKIYNILAILDIILFILMHSIVHNPIIRRPLFFITLLFSAFLFALFTLMYKEKKKLLFIPIIIFIICIMFYKSVYHMWKPPKAIS